MGKEKKAQRKPQSEYNAEKTQWNNIFFYLLETILFF